MIEHIPLEKSKHISWTVEEDNFIMNNWERYYTILQNARILSRKMTNRSMEAIKRRIIDFKNQGRCVIDDSYVIAFKK